MARADGSGSICSDVNDVEISAAADSDDRRLTAKLSSASFRSATSYASFRSCRSVKSSHSRQSSCAGSHFCDNKGGLDWLKIMQIVTQDDNGCDQGKF